MEYQQYLQRNPFYLHGDDFQVDAFGVAVPLPIDARLKQNKQRRLMIEKEKQKQKQHILQKRKQKEDNVQKILRERHEARENAKLVFGNMHKTFTDKFGDDCWRKAQDIQQKILDCRTRADQYRTMYMKKIHDTRQDREKNVRARKGMKDKQEKDKSLNYHLAEWRSYQKKIAQKYRGEVSNPKRMYEEIARREQGLNELIEKHRSKQEAEKLGRLMERNEYKEITITQQEKEGGDQDKRAQRSNPIYSIHEISWFGLPKSLRNPQKMFQSMKKFLSENTMMLDPTKDPQLLSKYERFLRLEHGGIDQENLN